MSRTLSAGTTQALLAPETDQVFVILLTINHADLAEPIRVAGNAEDVLYDGATYVAYPFELSLPPQSDDRPPTAMLRIDNVHRDIVQTIRSIKDAPGVRMDIVRVSKDGNGVVTVDELEASFVDFRLQNVSYNALTIDGELTLEHFVETPYPAGIFSPTHFPGMF